MKEYNTVINGERRRIAIGTKIGFGIKVMKADRSLPQEASQALEDAILESQQDGTKRRVVYHVKQPRPIKILVIWLTVISLLGDSDLLATST